MLSSIFKHFKSCILKSCIFTPCDFDGASFSPSCIFARPLCSINEKGLNPRTSLDPPLVTGRRTFQRTVYVTLQWSTRPSVDADNYLLAMDVSLASKTDRQLGGAVVGYDTTSAVRARCSMGSTEGTSTFA